MITNPRGTFLANLQKNDYLYLPSVNATSGIIYSAATHNNIRCARKELLTHLISIYKQLEQPINCWIISKNQLSGTVNRVGMYYKFWKMVYLNHKNLPSDFQTLESEHVLDNNVYFGGAIKCTINDVAKFVPLFSPTSYFSAVLFLDHQLNIQTILDEWVRLECPHPAGIINLAVNFQAVTASLFGAFDDPSVDLLLSGDSLAIEKCYNRASST